MGTRPSALVGVVALLVACHSRVADPVAPPAQPPIAADPTATQSITSAPAAVQAYVRDHAIPLRTVVAESGFDDMLPLRDIVADARVVSLGESTHGTREHFQLKHRMLEFLVTQMGFTLFAIEATMPEGFAVDDYVLHGRGDPRKVLAQLQFWTWDTEEVLAMIEWMRKYNADPAHTKKVRFFGVDMQSSPRAATVVLDYLKRVEPRRSAKAERRLEVLFEPSRGMLVDDWAPGQRADVTRAVAELAKRFDDNRDDYIARSDTDAYAYARQHVRILQQWVAVFLGWSAGKLYFPGAIRDSAMAANAQWLLDRHPGEKMVVWAHNAHVATDELGSMGGVLRKALGPALVVFGFAFYQGGFRARDKGRELREFTLPPAEPDSFDALLASAQHPILALDLRHALQDPDAGWWFRFGHESHSIGALFADAEFPANTFEITADLYDAILFVDTTTAARGTRRELLPPTRTLETPQNLGLELIDEAGTPAGWHRSDRFGAYDVELTLDADTPREGKRYATLRKPRVGAGAMGMSMTLGQLVDATAYRGKRVRVRAWVRSDVRGPREHADLYVSVFPATDPSVGMTLRPIESRRWTREVIEVDVPADATLISFGMSLSSEGEVSIDGVEILAD